MRPVHHVVASVAVSGAVYAIWHQWQAAIASLVAGTLIDLDHVVDYLLEVGPGRGVRDFFEHFYEKKYRRVMIFLHGWEWLFAFALISWQSGWNPWAWGALLGYAHHMALDAAGNGLTFKGYSFFWRYRKGFKAQTYFKEGEWPHTPAR